MKAFKSLFWGLGALVCASCTQQDEEPGASLNRSPHERVTVTAGPILPTQTTRVTTEREGNVMHFNWEKGDAILLANSTQQLPYLSTAAGPSTLFVSALTGSESYRDYINGVGGEGAVYAYYPYNQGEKIDMATKTVRINQDEPFLYAIDTIQADTLNLHFHHAFAYLRLNVSALEGEIKENARLIIAPDYLPLQLIGSTFNYATRQVEYTDYKDEMELTVEQLADTSRLIPILPTTEGEYIKFSCVVGDTVSEESYVYQIPIPEGGLQAGHVYQMTVEVDPLMNLLSKLYKETNGDRWKNNTNWLSNKPIGEWYGITTDAEGHITGIDLSDNNLVGKNVSFELPSTVTSFNINNNAIDQLDLRAHGLQYLQLDNCVKGSINVDSISTIEVSHCDSIYRIFIGTGCTKLTVSDCYFRDGYLSSNEGLDEVNITNCTISDYYISTNNLTCDNSQITNQFIGGGCIIFKKLTLINSLFTHLTSGFFNENTQINLQNATLKKPQGMYGITLPNVTQTLTGAEWNSLIYDYQGDYDILDNIYWDTRGYHNWTNNTNWMTDTLWSEWYGITTNDEGHLIAIDLSKNNLTDYLYFSIPENSHLTHLNIDKNKLTDLYINNEGTNLKDFSFNENESEMKRFEIYSVDSVQVSNCTIESFRNYGQVCSLSNCTTNDTKVSINNLLISKGTYGNLRGDLHKQLTVKDATLSLTDYSNLNVSDEADIVLENVTLKYGTDESTYTPVTVTKSLKGSEWQAFIKETFGIEDTGE